ncbi:MAG: HD domain-containing protein [Firmicutes bacterium]|nr:HD domain-containing protein [Bacillota bacterium]
MNTLALEMIKYYAGDIKRINHFIKVHGYAEAIGAAEGLDERTRLILETAAYVHDIGIKISEEKYNSSSGHYQEIEGPPIAEKMLKSLGYDDEIIGRVSYLVGHHHTYSDIDGIDYQILVEADFLVNIDEDGMDKSTAKGVREKIFKTQTGREMLDKLYLA